MNLRTIAAVAATAVAASCVLATTNASAQDLAPEACVGLTCGSATGAHSIPEAKGFARRVARPAELRMQQRPGFYAFDTLVGKTAVAYVVPKGHGGTAPDSVKRLTSYQSLANTGAFGRGTSVIFGSGVAEFTPDGEVGSLGYSACPSGWTCIWEDRDYGGRMLQFHDTGYWQNLGTYGFNDNADSIANKRGGDSLLAEHTGGGGDRYCYDSYSASSSLGGFGDDASSIYLSTSDGRC